MSTTDLYHRKRDPGSTPEPFGRSRRTGGRLFVVHHHSARHEHYDLRLEVDGALWSWAVPKGPSPNPADKRLAVHVDSHPVDYGFFEGVIPAENYGAGPTIVWDRGSWKPLADPEQGLKDGKLLFDLNGYKLRGRWTLVRTKQGWLFMKERDAYASELGTEDYPPDSILSGLTVDELLDPEAKRKKLRRSLASLGAPSAPMPGPLEPMLCTPGEPRDRDGWWYEIKYDGYRMIAHHDGDSVALRSRAGRLIGDNFPEITETLERLPFDSFVLDGEVVVEDARGLPSLQRLGQRAQLSRPADIERATLALPAIYYVFDLLHAEGRDLRGLPLEKRKRVLGKLLPSTGPVRIADHLLGSGEQAWEAARSLGYEGIVAKQTDSVYESRRAPSWEKWPVFEQRSFTIVGMRPAKSNPQDIGSLFLAERVDGAWVFRGRAGSGLGEGLRRKLKALLERSERRRPVVEIPEVKDGDRWVEPKSEVEIRYLLITEDGNLRQPVIVNLDLDGEEPPPPVEVEKVPERRVVTSNEDKVFWPDLGFTKGQLIAYYRRVASRMLPWLADRPVVLTRYPDGIDGKHFFQHNAPDFAPDWIRRQPIEDTSDGRIKQYFVIESEEALLYLANLGTIPIHMWSARCSSLNRPDWCVLDLDPKDAPFSDVVTIARGIDELCQELSLPHYVKTTGKTGLHILVPLGGQLDHEGAKRLGEVLARVVVSRFPDIATLTRSVGRRDGRVYVDFLQNGAGKTIAATYSAREVPWASVSMPLTWKEVNGRLDPKTFNIVKAPARVRKRKTDPAAAVLTEEPDLDGAMEALATVMGGADG